MASTNRERGTPAAASAAVPIKAITPRAPIAAAPERPAHLPHGRWLGDFEPLSEAEQKLVANCARGIATVLGDKRPEETNDSNRIRAGMVRFLALGGDDRHPVHESGIKLHYAWITGRIDMVACKVDFPLALLNCHITDTITLFDAHLDQLNLGGSRITSLRADRLTVEGGVFLRRGFEANGEVRLSGATIGGALSCAGGRFDNPNGNALFAERLSTGGSIFLNKNFHVSGEVRLIGARIGGNLACSGGQFDNPNKDALCADGSSIKGDVILGVDFHANGEVRLIGAEIGGDLNCSGGQFNNPGKDALSAERLEAKGGIFLGRNFCANGRVSLNGARIRNNLACSGGRFDNPSANALSADGLDVKGDIVLGKEFYASGEVRLLGANIGGDLSCSGGHFDRGLSIDGTFLRGALFMRRAIVTGPVSLASCNVHTLIDDSDCWPDDSLVLDNFRYDSIGDGPTTARQRTDWLKKQQSRYLHEDFCPQPWEQLIKVLREMGHSWDANQVAIEKQEMLRRARKIGTREPRKDFRLDWGRLLPTRKWIDLTWNWFSNRMARLFHICYGLLAGYGYRPTRILYWMLLVCSLSSLAYYEGRHDGLIGPTSAVIQSDADYRICGDGGEPRKQHWTQCSAMPSAYTTFQPFFYSLDLILPLVDLQQDPDWAPIVTSQTGETLWGGRLIRWLTWFEILFGWVMSLMFVAIVGRLVEKD